MHSDTSTISVAEYLVRRLRQVGVDHLFGVPGDFNLTLLDEISSVGAIEWVGSPNELGAGYAADAYARSRGFSALTTTYGVGELSCLNAIAGAAAEHAPVLEITGAPTTHDIRQGTLLHHTLCDGDLDHFARAYAEVTVAQATLSAETAATQIDNVMTTMLQHSAPGYLRVPSDIVRAQVDAARLSVPLAVAGQVSQAAFDTFAAATTDIVARAHRPVLIIGDLAARFHHAAGLTALARDLNIPIVVQPSAKGVIDEDLPQYHGVYAGTMLNAQDVVESADLVIRVGTVMSDVLSGYFTERPADEQTITIDACRTSIGTRRFSDMPFAEALAAVDTALRTARTATLPPTILPTPTHRNDAELDTAPLTQDALWSAMERWLPPRTALLADTGTAFWGAVSLKFPRDTVFVAQPVWNSIGYCLPATLGQGLADETRRPVLLIGDGAAEMTATELSTIATANVHPVIVLINNDGYTIERTLQSPHADYNTIARWDWRELTQALSPETAYASAHTIGEFRDALDLATNTRDRLVFVEAHLDPYDAPELLSALAQRHSDS